MIRFCSLMVLCLLLCTACSKPPAPRIDGNLVFYDKAGSKVASVQIDFPDEPEDVPTVNPHEFTGTYELMWSDPTFPATAMSQRKFIAQAFRGQWFADLNHGAHDHNVVLFATNGPGNIQGEWHLTRLGGSSAQGAFILTRSTSPDTSP